MKSNYLNKSVTILIPSLNEEANLSNILSDLLSQDLNGISLDKIIVISDGSIDGTIKIAKSFGKPITVKNFTDRKGKAYRLAQAFKSMRSEIIIVIDADQRIFNKNAIQSILNEFSKNVGLVCGYVKPNNIQSTLINKVANFGYMVWDRARKKLGDNGKRYYADGAFISYSSKLAKELDFPLSAKYIDDDSFSYYSAISKGYQVRVAYNAISYMKLPSTLQDYLSQMTRYLNADSYSENHFNHELIRSQTTMTSVGKFTALTQELSRHPVIGVIYIIVQLYTKLYATFNKPNNLWTQVKSTK